MRKRQGSCLLNCARTCPIDLMSVSLPDSRIGTRRTLHVDRSGMTRETASESDEFAIRDFGRLPRLAASATGLVSFGWPDGHRFSVPDLTLSLSRQICRRHLTSFLVRGSLFLVPRCAPSTKHETVPSSLCLVLRYAPRTKHKQFLVPGSSFFAPSTTNQAPSTVPLNGNTLGMSEVESGRQFDVMVASCRNGGPGV